ncbi:hypothetical protein D2962_13330 [Biomaibacter acetigenes]|uniref:Uncharacterized protein n=1 Tax=Biomaibacter acetigenes TaxID=2316383 RepID=A0A3G2R9L7_9FIRM|nr:hypothetical protein D2962_13330 [Biomaibacter acetigenes]
MEKVFLTSFNVSKWTNYIFDRLISLFIFVFFFLVVVVPNSFRFITIPLFFFWALYPYLVCDYLIED